MWRTVTFAGAVLDPRTPHQYAAPEAHPSGVLPTRATEGPQMPHRSRIRRHAWRQLGALVTVLGTPALASPARAQGRETLAALAEYRLTMPTLRRVLRAGVEGERGADPAAVREARWESSMSIEDMMAVHDRFPSLRRAIERNGLTAREYAIATLSLNFAFMQLAREEGARAEGRTPPAPPRHVPKENVELVRGNMSEIERLSQGS